MNYLLLVIRQTDTAVSIPYSSKTCACEIKRACNRKEVRSQTACSLNATYE